MKFQTHIVGGIALGLSASYFFNYPIIDTTFYYSAIVLGSLLPDIDHSKSFLGRRLPFLSKPLHKIIGHRTLTHSIILSVVFLELMRLTQNNPFITGLTLGIASHILLDLLTPQGVAIFYPISKKRYRLVKK